MSKFIPADKKGKQKHTGVDEHLHKDVSYEWQESVNEVFEELMEQRGERVPSVSVLLEDVKKIIKTPVDVPVIKPVHESDELSQLMEDQLREIEDEENTPKVRQKPIFTDSPQSKASVSKDYQESFTSQQETAELRDELSSLSSRLINLEATLEGIVAERSNLPNHLERLSVSINTQFTIMNDRLNAAIESGITAESAKQISDQVTELVDSSSKILDTVKDDLGHSPSSKSQVSQPKPITGKKKRVRLVE